MRNLRMIYIIINLLCICKLAINEVNILIQPILIPQYNIENIILIIDYKKIKNSMIKIISP